MDRHTDAFFTDEQVASFVDHLSEQELCIYINQNDHPASKLTDVISEKSLDLTNHPSTGSIVPTASEMAAIREREELRELQRSRNSGGHCVTIDSLPYVHDDENNHFKTTPGSDEDCCGEREETHEDITTRSVESNFCNDDVNEGSINTNERGVDSETINTNEHDVDSETIIDNEQKINKSLSEDELGNTDNNKTADCELQPPDTQTKKKKSSYNNINDGIIAQREKIRDISANRERSSKKKKKIRRGNYFNEVRQKYSNFDSESDSDSDSDCESEESNKKQDEYQRQQQEVDEQSASNESSEGFLDTEDEQSDDLIEFETQTELPIARKKRKARNSNTLLASSEAIGSSIAKAAASNRGVSSEWISRNDAKRRSKLKKKRVNRVSLEPSSSSSNAVRTNNQTFRARESGGRRKTTVGFAAAPRAINKRKTQLSLHQIMTKKK